MIFLGITVVIGIIFFVKVMKPVDAEERSFTIFLGSMLGLIAGGVFLIPIILTLRPHVEYTEQIHWESSLHQLNLDRSAEGGFFLGCGRIEGKRQYYAYVENAKKEIYLKIFDIDECVFILTNQTPKVENVIDVLNNKWWMWLSFIKEHKENYYRFRIPKNSIYTDYNISLK